MRPSVIEAVDVCIRAGAPGITVHPRADGRHITAADVRDIAAFLGSWPGVELNVVGDPRPDLWALVREIRPAQCTLVPVQPGVVTSQAGWPADTAVEVLGDCVGDLRARGTRVSVFIDPVEEAVRWAASLQADRVELYTEPFARAFEAAPDGGEASFATYARMAALAHQLGLGVNAGHDLDLNNLVRFRALPHLAEVSIGHALISRALFVGLDRTVREYLDILRQSPDASPVTNGEHRVAPGRRSGALH
jgi:pyridoxine 5-phosphate synthase